MSMPYLPSPYPSPGEIIDGKYQIDRILGEGGMGCVARAFHIMLRAPVALKFMNPQFMTFPGAVDRFLNEGIASKAIKSDHVVATEDVGKLDSGAPYLVMPCLDGLDLADLLARDGTPGLPIERAVYFVIQILRGLQAAHAIGIIHRDMKPSNCFVVTHDGEADFVKILDFGISKVAQPGSASLTQTNSALGTPLYMSPEQARSPRDVDARSDLYSVGVILYELLSGSTPYFSETGEFTDILFKLFTAEPPPVKERRPDLPDELAAVVHKALARDVKDRYASADEMAEALVPWANARAQAVLARIRGFKPPEKSAIAPPGLPSSMVAFSAIPRGVGTDLMANRPKLGGGGNLPEGFTQAMPDAPGRVIATPTGASAARPEEAVARTHASVNPPAPAGTVALPRADRTDLGASRDTTGAGAAHAPGAKKSPVVFVAIGLVGLLAIGGAAAVAMRSPKTDPTTNATTSDPTTSVTKDPASAPNANVTLPPVQTAMASASAATSASASASATAPPPPDKTVKTPPKHTSAHPAGDPPDPGLDTNFKR